MKRYLITYTPRSGAAWLMDILAATGKAGVESVGQSALFVGYGDGLKSVTPSDMSKLIAPSDGIRGLRTNWGYLNHLALHWPPKQVDMLLTSFDQYILLTREDTGAAAASWYLAEMTGQWNSTNRTAITPDRVPYDAAQIASRQATLRQEYERWAAWYTEHGITPYEIDYESMAEPGGMLKTVKALYKFLGLTGAPTKLPEGTLKKLVNVRQEEYTQRFRVEKNIK